MDIVKEQPSGQTESTGNQSTAPSSPSSSSVPRSTLRRLSYKAGAEALEPGSAPARTIASDGLSGAGKSVEGGAAARFATATGVDVGGAKEHTGPRANAACEALGNVQAYSLGGDIGYRDASPKDHVRFHELAHVAQDAGGVQAYGGGNAGLEANADAVADAVVSGGTAAVGRGATGLAFYHGGEDDPNITQGPVDDAETTQPEIEEQTETETPKKSEAEQIEETHGRTIEALILELTDLAAHKKKRVAKKKSAAGDAKSIFGMLAQYDSEMITTAWEVVLKEPEIAAEFDLLVEAIGYKNAARSFPREARATLAAADAARLVSFANDVVKKNPFAAELALSLLATDSRDAFLAEHPEFAKGHESLGVDTESMAIKDEALRSEEEDFRKRAGETKEAEREKSEGAEKAAGDAAPIIAGVNAQIAAGAFKKALKDLCAVKDESVFLAAVRGVKDKELISGLTFREKWNEHPQLMKRLFAARPSADNLQMAHELLDIEHFKAVTEVTKKSGKTKTKTDKNAVLTSVEAYGAFQLLKALPATQREFFEKTYPDLIVAMNGHLNESMRRADDTNMFGAGGGDEEIIAQLVVKVGDDTLWFESPVGQLDQTLRMVTKAGRRDVIAAKLTELENGGRISEVAGDAARRSAVEGALGLVGDPNTVPEGVDADAHWKSCLKLSHKIEETDEGLAGHAAYGFNKEGVANAVVHANRKTRRDNREDQTRAEHNEEMKEWREAKKLAEEKGEAPPKKPDPYRPTLIGQIVGAMGKNKELDIKNLALDEIQGTVDEFAYGGEFEFKDYGERKGDSKDEEHNLADIEFDQNQGIFNFDCAQMELEMIRYPFGDMTVETGPVTMMGLKLHATWATAQNPSQTTTFSVEASSVQIGNVMVTQPGTIIGIGHIATGALHYSTSEQTLKFDDNAGASEVLALLKQHNPARSIIKFGLQSYLGGNQATNENLAALTEAFTGSPSGSMGGMVLEVESMEASGITYNAETYVDKAEAEGLSLVWDNRPSVTGQARLSQLAKMIEDAEGRRAELAKDDPIYDEKDAQLKADVERWVMDRGTIEGDMPAWLKLEAVYQQIYEHQRLHGGAGPAEAVTAIETQAAEAGIPGAVGMDLAELITVVQATLTEQSGLVASLDSAAVKGVDSYGVQTEDATVAGINISGKGDGFGAAVDPELVSRLGSTDGETAKKGKSASSHIDMDIAEVKVTGVKIDGGIPSEKDLEALPKKRAELEKEIATLTGIKPDERTPEQTAKLSSEKAKLKGFDATWNKIVPGGSTYKCVVEEMLKFRSEEGMDRIKKDPALLKEWQDLGKKLQGEPTTVASITALGLSGSSDLTTTTTKDGTKTTTTTTSESKTSLGSLEATGIKHGETTVASVAATGIKGNADVTNVSETDSETGETKTQSTTGTGHIELGNIVAKGVKSGGTTVDEVNVKKLALDVTANADDTKLHLKVGEISTKGIGLQKGIDVAKARQASLEGQIAAVREKGQDPGALEVELATLNAQLGTYTDAYAQQTTIKGELEAIDDQIDAAKTRLRAAKEEAAVFKHRVSRSEEQAIPKADKARIEAIEKGLEGLAMTRAAKAAELTKPQALISVFESDLGIEDESSIKNIDIKVEGAPSLTELQKKKPDLSGPLTIAVSAGPLTIPTVNYNSPGMNVQLGSATMDKFVAHTTVNIAKKEGTTGYKLGAIDIQDLSIPTITGNDLVLTMPVGGELVEIKLPTATMSCLDLKNVHLAGLDAASMKTATGELDIASIDTDLSATMGDSVKANGNLSLTGIHAEALASGALNFGFAGLTLDDFGFEQTTAPASGLAGQIMKLGGKANKLGKVTLEGSYDRVGKSLSTTVGLGDLTLSGIDYRGGGTNLGVAYASLKNATVTVKAQFKEGKVEPGESSLESLVLEELKCDRLSGNGIHYVGTGKQKERFEDGTEKVHDIKNEIHLERGRLHNLSVRGLKLVGEGPTSFGMSLGSGSVSGLNAVMEKDGKNVLKANVSADISAVEISLVDDELSVDAGKIDASEFNATMGEGKEAINVDTKGMRATDTHVDVHDMGKEDTQSMDVSVAKLTAQGLSFEKGIKGSPYHNKPTTLANVTLNGVNIQNNKDTLTVDVKDGHGMMIGSADITHSNTSEKGSNTVAVDDQFFVPLHLVTWKSLKQSTLDGFLKVKYPDGSQFLRLNFSAGGVALDLQQNIDRMWDGWAQGFKRDSESAFDHLWERSKKVTKTAMNPLWAGIFKGLEFGLNALGKRFLGDWPAIETMILGSLNSSPKTSLVKGGAAELTSFTDQINEVIQTYVEPAISGICATGIISDVALGDWERAAKTTGNWMMERAGDALDWGGSWFGVKNVTDMDDNAAEQQAKMREQRRAEIESMFKSGVAKMLGWGVDLDLHSSGGRYQADKVPNPNPKGQPKKKMLSTGLNLDMTGGGTLASLGIGTVIGLTDLAYSDAGTTVGVDQMTLLAAGGTGVHGEYGDGVELQDGAGVSTAGLAAFVFSGLRYEMDKTVLPSGPAGVETTHQRSKRHGTTSNEDSPVSDGNGVYYNAADYAHRVNTGQQIVGEQYTTELSTTESIKRTGLQYGTDAATKSLAPTRSANHQIAHGETVGTTVAKSYESSIISARNAELYGKYEGQYDEKQKKKRELAKN